jgi:polar amino acid transport system permease protein
VDLGLLANIWDNTIGGAWDDLEPFRTQYYDFPLMWDYRSDLLKGFWETIQLTVFSGVLALAWGLVLAALRQLPGKAAAPIRGLTIAYIDVFRGIPVILIMLLVSGSMGAFAVEGFLPREIGIPRWFGKPDPFWYGVIALTVTYGAYMAEVYRAGIEAVPSGQMEAARSLGMSHSQAMRKVIVPQAVSKVIPPLLNDIIALMKDTSLVLVLGFTELTQVGRDAQAETFNSSVLVGAGFLYLIATIPLARLVDWLIARQQRRTSRGGGDATVVPLDVGHAGSVGGRAGT